MPTSRLLNALSPAPREFLDRYPDNVIDARLTAHDHVMRAVLWPAMESYCPTFPRRAVRCASGSRVSLRSRGGLRICPEITHKLDGTG